MEPNTCSRPEVSELARRLSACVGDLDIPYFQERSVRFSPGYLGTRRFLLSIDPANLRRNAMERLLVICRRLEMPQSLTEEVWSLLPTASCIHFGFEENRGNCLYKIYLEQAQPAIPGNAPVLLHLAYKWTASGGKRWVKTRYVWHPNLPLPSQIGRVKQIHKNPADELFTIVQKIVEQAGCSDYLEVSEEGSPRKSYDLNLYDANLEVRDINAHLFQLSRQFSIPDESLNRLLQGIGKESLGHIAGGTHRQGEEFLTLYFGVKPR